MRKSICHFHILNYVSPFLSRHNINTATFNNMPVIATILLHLKVIHIKLTMMRDKDYLSFIDHMKIDNLLALNDGCIDAFSTIMRESAVGLLQVGFAKGRKVCPGVSH